jgi:iron complex transport system permease protein
VSGPVAPATAAGVAWPDPGRGIRGRLVVLGLLAFTTAIVSIAVGSVAIGPEQVLGILVAELGIGSPWAFSAQQESVLLAIRLPRVLLGAAVGAGLGVAGAAMQGVYRSPLADPALVGVGSGAALGAAAGSMVALAWLGATTGEGAAIVVVVAALAGAVLVSVLLFRIASATGRTLVSTMLLAGIALSAMLAAPIGMLTLVVRDPQLHDLTFWTTGSLTGATWRSAGVVAVLVVAGALAVHRRAGALDALALGQAEAGHLGVDVAREQRVATLLVALLVAAAVAFAGLVGFVALLAPFVVRKVVGARHRPVVIGSALLGAATVLAADLVARSLVAPSELPLGLVTALVGGPVFLWLLVRDRSAVVA